MLTRTAFKPKRPEPRASKQYEGESPAAPRAPAPSLAPTPMACEPIEKENALQHEGYMNLVRAMKCAHCGRAPRSEFAHSDAGKGAGIKTDCRRGWPGCGDDVRTSRIGCHSLLGMTGTFSKEHRRLLEDTYSAQTRAAIVAAGKWPKSLPRWEEEGATA